MIRPSLETGAAFFSRRRFRGRNSSCQSSLGGRPEAVPAVETTRAGDNADGGSGRTEPPLHCPASVTLGCGNADPDLFASRLLLWLLSARRGRGLGPLGGYAALDTCASTGTLATDAPWTRARQSTRGRGGGVACLEFEARGDMASFATSRGSSEQTRVAFGDDAMECVSRSNRFAARLAVAAARRSDPLAEPSRIL